MELTTQMKKNADTMRTKTTPPYFINTTEHVASMTGGELPVQQPFLSGSLLEVTTKEIKALVLSETILSYLLNCEL